LANKTINVKVLCPFFITESKKSISCEGIIGSKCVSCFEFTEDKEVHEKEFCTTRHYYKCKIYSALMKGYMKEGR